jgi:Secretion system C-terminal sorting domain
MRKLFLLFLLATGFIRVNSQVTADPATGQMDINSISGTVENANFLNPNIVYRLKVPVFNLNQLNSIPAGTSQLKIGLGLKLKLDPAFTLATAPLSNYFNWTVATVNNEVVITGNLIAALPGDFADLAEFNVKGSVLGTSDITTNFIILSNLLDEDPANNSSTLQYTITNQTIPVTFTSINASKKDCAINLLFTTEHEVNVKKYVIEWGTDGIFFTKAGELKATGSNRYSLTFSTGKQVFIFVRVKSIDQDGKTTYSEIKTVKYVCRNGANIRLRTIPNPVSNQAGTVQVVADDEVLNGQYNLILADVTGRMVLQQKIHIANAGSFTYNMKRIKPGSYFLKIQQENGNVSGFARLVKL